MTTTTTPTAARHVSRGRMLAFAVLVACVVFLSFDYQGALGRALSEPARPEGWPAAESDARALLDREYDTVVQEIRARNEIEHQLFALKFTLVGATLFVLFQQTNRTPLRVSRSEYTALVAWAAVLAGAIVDLRTASNQAFIATLGLWVRQYELGVLLPTNASSLGWEAFLGRHLLEQAAYPALRISGQILTALLFSIAAAVLLLPSTKNENIDARVWASANACRWGGTVSLVIMIAAAVSLRRTAETTVAYALAGLLAIAMLWWLSYRKQSDPIHLEE